MLNAFASGKTTVLTSLFVGSLVSLALSLILPRLIGGSNGLAAATAAALAFAGCYLLSLSLSVYLLGLTLLGLKRLSGWRRTLGVIPFILVVIVGIRLGSLMT